MSYAYVGTWGVDSKSSGGIHVLTLDQKEGSLTCIDRVSPNVNAGMICISTDQRFLYCTDERKNFDGRNGSGGGVCAYAIDRETGSLQLINRVPSMGVFPCHISIDASGSYIFVSNHGNDADVVTKVIPDNQGSHKIDLQYDDGTIAMFPVRKDGGLGDACDVKVLTGNSIDSRFQASSHPHSTSIDLLNKFAIVCDKGSDQIITYRINNEEGKLAPVSSLAAIPGSGPRHLVFHPTLPYLFTANELNSTISAYSFKNETGELLLVHHLPTLPDDYEPEDASDPFARNFPADIQIHPNGKYICVSNRGHNSIATYKIDDETGGLTLIDFTPTQGEIPRALGFDPSGRFLFATNQITGSIVSFLVDTESGVLSPTGAITHVANLVCIKLVKFHKQ